MFLEISLRHKMTYRDNSSLCSLLLNFYTEVLENISIQIGTLFFQIILKIVLRIFVKLLRKLFVSSCLFIPL